MVVQQRAMQVILIQYLVLNGLLVAVSSFGIRQTPLSSKQTIPWLPPQQTWHTRIQTPTSTTTTQLSESNNEVSYTSQPPCRIKVVGVGGGGGNAVNHMLQAGGTDDLEFLAVNTDAQALSQSRAETLVIGRLTTRGLGAGGDPQIGYQAAQESLLDLEQTCRSADLVFVTAGMGGGTGSGAAPVLAQCARDLGCLSVAVVTRPFAFEGQRRQRQAQVAIDAMAQRVDTMIVISNDKLLEIVPANTPLADAFRVADDVLRQGVLGIAELITRPGLINVDFADVRSILKDAGAGLLGIGAGTGKNRAVDAAINALSSPLLDVPIQRAQRVMFQVVGGPSLSLAEINAASQVIATNADDNANIIFGAMVDERMGEDVRITVLACDLKRDIPQPVNGYASSSPLFQQQPLPPAASVAPPTRPSPPQQQQQQPRQQPPVRGFKRAQDPSKRRNGLGGFFRSLRGD